jgi:hypothetical protein
MAFRAYIEGVRDNPVPAENIFVNVRFEDAASSPPRTIYKEYKYVSGTTAAEFTDIILADRNRLRALDNAREVLVDAIGTEVT